MSGPKKSQWEIKEEIRRKREEEKRKKRLAQINEIKSRIMVVEKELKTLDEYTQKRVIAWLREIDINGDLRLAFRSLRGIEKYLNHKQQTMESELKEKLLKEAKVEAIIEDLEAIKDEFSDILNEAIMQRIELFKNAIKINYENQNTIEQIRQFKSKLSKMQEERAEHKKNLKYVANTFSKILKGNIDDRGENLEIMGEIDGVPIRVKLDKKSKNIDFDTPINSSCKKAMESISQKLLQNSINLGAIRVVKTGQVLNQRVNQKRDIRIKQ